MTRIMTYLMLVMLLVLVFAGCAHRASGGIGVEGGFRLQLMQNGQASGQARLARM